MRDVKAEDTIYLAFTTRAFSTGIPTTLAGTPVVSAYEDAGLTQITAGITLGVDHDGVTGLNMLTIVATAANGYDTGKDYNLVITTGTVDSVSAVGEVVGRFSIDRAPAAQDLANGTDGLGAIKADTAAILTDTGTTIPADILDKVGAVSEAAAAGDPSATESVMQYVKQIVNMLGGTDGITTMPAAAAPANAVSIAEMVRSIYDDTNSLDGTKIPDTISLANINAEVVDVTNTDTSGEPAQGAPAATASMRTKIDWLYKFLRNKTEVTATTISVYDDAGTTVDHKSTHSDDGTTYTRGEFATGP